MDKIDRWYRCNLYNKFYISYISYCVYNNKYNKHYDNIMTTLWQHYDNIMTTLYKIKQNNIN